MKKFTLILLTLLAPVMVGGVGYPRESRRIPMGAIAGKRSSTLHGFVTLCYVAGTLTDNGTMVPKACTDSDASSVTVTLVEVGTTTADKQGNLCGTGNETGSVPGAPVTLTVTVHNVGKLIDYDPATGEGDEMVSGYAGGNCVGSTFDSTGATLRSVSQVHFVASERGRRLDTISTSLSSPVFMVGSFSVSGTSYRQ